MFSSILPGSAGQAMATRYQLPMVPLDPGSLPEKPQHPTTNEWLADHIARDSQVAVLTATEECSYFCEERRAFFAEVGMLNTAYYKQHGNGFCPRRRNSPLRCLSWALSPPHRPALLFTSFPAWRPYCVWNSQFGGTSIAPLLHYPLTIDERRV